MPNLVHSLDAASLAIVINNYFNQDKIVVSSTPVNSTNSNNITNKGEALDVQAGRSAATYPEISFPQESYNATQLNSRNSQNHSLSHSHSHSIKNINFYSIHDCFAVPCNKMSKIIELLKTAYIIIYSKKKYLLEFDANFITAIKKRYGENAVSFNEKDELITINTELDSITIKYIPIKKIIDSKITQIDVSQSTYIAH
jgi:DNA-dependent RNA polymerase